MRHPIVCGEIIREFTVLEQRPANTRGHRQALVECSCGKQKVVRISSITKGKVKSCGHVLKEKAAELCRSRSTHGMAPPEGGETVEFIAWWNMKARCNNPNASSYEYYGGRGIRVCDEWQHSFEAFYACVGPKPAPEYSLDRIDVNGNYEPGNVRWATPSQQSRNRRPFGRKAA